MSTARKLLVAASEYDENLREFAKKVLAYDADDVAGNIAKIISVDYEVQDNVIFLDRVKIKMTHFWMPKDIYATQLQLYPSDVSHYDALPSETALGFTHAGLMVVKHINASNICIDIQRDVPNSREVITIYNTPESGPITVTVMGSHFTVDGMLNGFSNIGTFTTLTSARIMKVCMSKMSADFIASLSKCMELMEMN